ncbi:hypothetical protein [Massilia sp. S19_KUP03_FR1]|uniref:hypothetical protein n=1 Tax=Massilia sp. S19_KUP03_FR1 TaxID=3025503 RepID=UPI002FCD9131
MAEFEELKNLLRQPRKSGYVAFLYNWQRIQNNRTCDPSPDFLLQAQEVIGWIRVKIVADDI